MNEINYFSDCLYSQINESNTKSRKYFQAQIQLTIRLEKLKWYDQQYNQNNMISNTMRTNLGVIMVILSVTSTQRPKKPKQRSDIRRLI